jgi:CRP-like cAMP-binding protein
VTINHLADPMLRKLRAIAEVSAQDAALVRKLRITPKELQPKEDLVKEGSRPGFSAVLLSGMLYRYQNPGEGKRQILSLHLPGDIPDLQSLYLKTMDHSLGAIDKSVVGIIPHEDLREMFQRSFHLASVMWRDTLIDAAIFRQWISNTGSRSALAAMAHLLCELYLRAQSIGLVEEASMKLPLTQQDFADALGLSNVHVSRTLRRLRNSRMIEWKPGVLTVLDWNGLKEVGDFEPTYLHLANNQAVLVSDGS